MRSTSATSAETTRRDVAPAEPAGAAAPAHGSASGSIPPSDVLGADADARHVLLEVRWQDGTVVGRAEAAAAAALERFAQRHGAPQNAQVLVPEAGAVAAQGFLRAAPQDGAAHLDEVVLGDDLEVFETVAGWARVRTARTAYLGWLPVTHVAPPVAATHVVTALRAHAYLGPRIQAPIAARLAWGARLRALGAAGDGWTHVVLPDARDAFVRSAALAEADAVAPQPWDATWPALEHTPYVWGGATPWGTDCSGLVYQVMRMAGRPVPRDSDEQQARGRWVEAPRPGDVIAFRGHVGLHLGGDRFVHASTSGMRVTVDRLAAVGDLRERLLGYVRFEGTGA